MDEYKELEKQTGKTFYETVEGQKVQLVPLSLTVMQKLYDQVDQRWEGKIPECPTYSMTIGKDGTQQFEYDNKSIVDGSDADKAAWEERQKVLKQINEEKSKAINEYILLAGVKIDIPTDDSWLVYQRDVLGLENIPTDLRGLRLHYILTEVLKVPGDLYKVYAKVMRLTQAGGMTEEELDAAENRFLDTVRGKRSEDSATEDKPSE